MKVKAAAGLDNLNPIIAMALAPFAPPPAVEIDAEWLAFCEGQLRNAKYRAEILPEWNRDKKMWQDEVIKLERDIEELKAGVQRDELTSVKNWQMPAWGTYGT